ncbi:hypothetical protein EKO04_002272 [Neofusicoccum parvum]|nr:hypothetical protein EKO04_002272 [Neofusicoccum parvum]
MRLPLSRFCLPLAAASLAAGQNQTDYCNSTCQSAFEAALALESASWVSQNVTLDPFYSLPSNVSGEPGTLLRWQDIPASQLSSNWTVPGGLSLSRFLYLSEDVDGSPLPASAFVLLPYSPVTAADDSNETNTTTPFNTVVFTHGTAGRIRNCAPSNHRGLYYEWEGPLALASAGFAVVAPDYAGLGTEIAQGFMYEAGFAHAADAALALAAARASAVGPLLSAGWVVAGHSEGGMTAWRVNERLAMADQAPLRARAGVLLGAVAGAPALRPLDLIPESFARAAGGPVGDVVSVYLLQSIAALFPADIAVEDYLSDLALARLARADRACLITGDALFGGLTRDELYKDVSWLRHPRVVEWQRRWNGAGGPRALAAPMLVVQGEADPLTYAENTEWDFDQTCAAFPDTRATYQSYPGLNHDVSFQASQPNYVRWIRERFEGVEVARGCVKETVRPVTDRYGTVQISWSGSA